MASGDDRDGHDRGAWASERVYRALTRLYPEEVRRRYAEEMVRYFANLCREEWLSRGSKGMALLWARTLPELVFTALKERSALLPRNAYLPVAPSIAARWGALCALVGGLLGMACYFIVFPLVLLVWWYMTILGFEFFKQTILYAATLLCILGILASTARWSPARVGRDGSPALARRSLPCRLPPFSRRACTRAPRC